MAGSIRGGRESCQPMSGTAVDIIRRSWAQLRARHLGLLPVSRLAGAAAHWLWPPRCALCRQLSFRPDLAGHAPGGSQPDRQILDLCAGCEADLPLNDSACEHCAEPLPANHSTVALCGRCLQQAPAFDACFAPFRYAYPVDRMIQGLKYRHDLVYGRVLGQLLALHLSRRETRPELVIPVPLGTARYRERGFNQARELALPVCEALDLTLNSQLIVRCRETPEQAALDRKDRLTNTQRAFALTSPLTARHVAIVDDVVTTGSTANEISKVLRSAGAEWIEVWAVARAERK
jgi:ComF family protein